MNTHRRPASLSLAFELSDLAEALDGVELLLEPLRDRPAEVHVGRQSASASAVLGLARYRVRSLLAAVRGQADPAALVTASNRPVEPTGEPGTDDIVLTAWTEPPATRAARRHRGRR